MRSNILNLLPCAGKQTFGRLTFTFLIAAQSIAAHNIGTIQFGTVRDAAALDMKTLQMAIDICVEAGGGEVTVPPGTYIIGTICLCNNVELHLCRGSTIRGSYRNPEGYPTRSLIIADGIKDAGISGSGIIDDNVQHPKFQKNYRPNDDKHPYTTCYKDCKRMSLRDIGVRDTADWTIRLFHCDGVIVGGISIFFLSMGNNDGIDVDTRNVNITNCHIKCDGDGICLGSDDPNFTVENITVANCIIASNCNPIKLGTASWIGFHNIMFSNCVARPTTGSNIWNWPEEYRHMTPGIHTELSGIAIKSVDGDIVEQVTFNNISMEGIITPIFAYLTHRRMNQHNGQSGIIRNLLFNNITAKAEDITPTLIAGTPTGRITDITLYDITVEHAGGEKAMIKPLPENLKGYPGNRVYGKENPAGGFYIRHADNILIGNFHTRQRNTDERPSIFLDDATDIHIEKLQSTGSMTKKIIEHPKYSDITIDGRVVR